MARGLRIFVFILLVAFVCTGFVFAQQSDEQTDQQGSEESSGAQQAVQKKGAATGNQYTYRELKALQERLELIKERLLQYRSRLLGLKDQLALTKMAVINASIKYRDEVGGTFELLEVHFYLDGFEIYRASGEEVHKAKEVMIYEGSLLPGEHLLSAELVYRGKGYGVFAYMKKNVYRVRSRYAFDVEEGQEVMLDVVSLDRGKLLGSVAERLKVEYEIYKQSTSAEEAAAEKGEKEKEKKKGKKKESGDRK